MFYSCQVTEISSSTGNTFFVPTWGSSPRSTTLGKLPVRKCEGKCRSMFSSLGSYRTIDTAGDVLVISQRNLWSGRFKREIRKTSGFFGPRPFYSLCIISEVMFLATMVAWSRGMTVINPWRCLWGFCVSCGGIPFSPSFSGISATVGLSAVASGGRAEGFRLSSQSRSARVCLSQHVMSFCPPVRWTDMITQGIFLIQQTKVGTENHATWASVFGITLLAGNMTYSQRVIIIR